MNESANKKTDEEGSGGRRATVRTLRFQLRFLLLLVALPASAIIVILGVQERRQLIDSYHAETTRVTGQLVRQQAKLIEDTRLFLIELAQTSAVLDPSDPACGAFLAKLLPLKPQYVNIGVPRANGDLLCNAKPLKRSVNVADRPYIRRAMDDEVFSVGSFQMDRVAQVVSINFAYPVKPTPDNSKPVGVVVAVVSLDWWSEALANQNLPEGAMAIVSDSADQVIATFPDRPELLGHLVSEVGLSPQQISSTGGGILAQPDGLDRIFSHQVLFSGPGYGSVQMSLGIPVDVGLAAAKQRAAIRIVAFGGLLVAFWLIAARLLERRVLRPLDVMNSEIRRIGRGGRQVPEDGIEIRPEHVSGFDEIAQSIRKVSREIEQAETAKSNPSEQLAALLAAMPDNYFRFDGQGIILDYRLRLKISFIKDPVAHYGHKFVDVLPPGARELFEENYRKHRETGDIVTWDYHLDVDGILQVREGRLCPIAGSDQSVLVVRDITKRYMAEENRALAEIRLQRIVASLPGAVLSRKVTKEEGSVALYVSSKSEEIWGYTPEEVYATKDILEATINPDDLNDLTELLAKCARNCETYSHRYRVTARSGERKWLETHTNCYLHEDGTMFTDGFVTDVTAEVVAQRQFEAQKEIANRAQKLESLGQLTGGVAHEFNNLLAAIMGSLELLRDDLSDIEHLSLIDAGIASARRGADLTRNMLAFARRARLKPCEIDLNKLVNETRSWAGHTLPSNISVETSLLTGLWTIEADISSTEHALLNLILNARDAMPQGGDLTIETSNVRIDKTDEVTRKHELEPGQYVMLAVSDTGVGISDETLVHIFEPFFSTKPVGSGSGLGLPMILGFMKQSGGTVQVDTEADVGTTFKLYFKALTDEIVPSVVKPGHPGNPSHAGKKILIAEDEKNIRTILVAFLSKAGYVVTAAATGEEALALFDANPTFDLLLTDLAMPGGIQGPALSQTIRKQNPELPIVFMSGYTSEAIVDGIAFRPEDIRLTKPILRADLLEAVRTSLGD